MGLSEIKHSFKIERFTNHFFKTVIRAGILRIKNAHVALLEVNFIRFARKKIFFGGGRVYTKSPQEKKR